MIFTVRSGDNLDVIFHDLSTKNGNQIIKKNFGGNLSPDCVLLLP